MGTIVTTSKVFLGLLGIFQVFPILNLFEKDFMDFILSELIYRNNEERLMINFEICMLDPNKYAEPHF